MKDAIQSLYQRRGAGRSSSSRPGFKEVGAEGARARRGDRRTLPLAGRAADGAELPGRAQHAPPDERHLRPGAAAAGQHLGHLAVRRALRGDPRLGRASRSSAWRKVISIGNKADLNEADFLQALAEDKETAVIAGYLESITDGNEFLRVAEEAATIKPVVILKVGITSGRRQGRLVAHRQSGRRRHRLRRGVQALRRHSRGELRGAVRLRAGLRHAAAARRATASPSSPTPAGRASWPPTPRRRCGLKMVAPERRHQGQAARSPARRRRASATRSTCSATPTPTATSRRFERRPGRRQRRRHRRGPHAAEHDRSRWRLARDSSPRRTSGTKPVLAAFMGGDDVEPAQEKLMALGIPNYPSPERAVARAAGDVRLRRLAAPPAARRHPLPGQPPPRRARHPAGTCAAASSQIGEVEAKEILRAYDFNVLDGDLATDRRRGRRGRRAHRLPGGDEDLLARHHPQVRRRRRAAQPGQRRAGARRLRPDDAAHPAARARGPICAASTSRRWASAAARSSSA